MKTFPEKPQCQRLISMYDDKKRSTQLVCGPYFESTFSERFLILTKFPILSYCKSPNSSSVNNFENDQQNILGRSRAVSRHDFSQPTEFFRRNLVWCVFS